MEGNVPIVHAEHDCPLVKRRIACNECGYPYSEACFGDVREYLEFLLFKNKHPESSKAEYIRQLDSKSMEVEKTP